MPMNPTRVAFAIIAWLFLAAVVVQVLFAGAALFQLTTWETHSEFGWGVGSIPILLLVIAALGRFERRLLLPTVGVTILAVIQPELAAAREDAPLVAAFHPLNAMLVFWLGWTVARRSIEGLGLPARLRRTAAGAGTTTDPVSIGREQGR
jgi:mercuric ion transport protein